MPQTKNENKAWAKLYIVLKGFFAKAKTVEFVQFRVKHFCPKIDPLFLDFCLWGEGGKGWGRGGEKDALWSPLSGKKKFAKIALWVQCADFAWQNNLEIPVLPPTPVLPPITLYKRWRNFCRVFAWHLAIFRQDRNVTFSNVWEANEYYNRD